MFFGFFECLTEGVVEFCSDLAGIFNMLALIFSYRHNISVIEHNICRHERWVGKKSRRRLLPLPRRVLIGMPEFEERHWSNTVENPCQLGVSRDIGLFKNDGFYWI